MFTFGFILICSIWCLYTHFAWYVNGSLPYPKNIFGESNIYLHSLKLFSINWALIVGVVGVAFCCFLLYAMKNYKKGLDEQMTEGILWKAVIIFYGLITFMTIW